MNNQQVWNKEYREKKLMRGEKPQKSFLNFLKWLKKEKKKAGEGFAFAGRKVLDLGSGNGKNSIYLAKKGAKVFGLEFSSEAIKLAEKLFDKNKKEIKIAGGSVNFSKKSIGEKFDFPDNYFDIILDITSSNSLSERERDNYLRESRRVLKDNGYFFARGLLKDGDKNASFLLKNFPGQEKDTYIIPDFGLNERVFSKDDLFKLYQNYFDILKFQKETHYTSYGNKKYKRNFWILFVSKARVIKNL